MTPLDIPPREAMSDSPAVRRAVEGFLGKPLSNQEQGALMEGGLDPRQARSWNLNGCMAAFATAYFEDDPESRVLVSDPNIWSEDRVRAYLGFEPYPANDGFGEFAEALLEEAFPADPEQVEGCQEDDGTYNMRYYYAEQFACGSVIPGVRALWYRWPNCDWQDFAAWLAGSSPETSSSRRDFLMAGGDFMRVWREVSAMHEGWPDGWPDDEPETVGA